MKRAAVSVAHMALPKASSTDSWWLQYKTSAALNKEAKARFSSATSRESFTGVVYQTAKNHGVL